MLGSSGMTDLQSLIGISLLQRLSELERSLQNLIIKQTKILYIWLGSKPQAHLVSLWMLGVAAGFCFMSWKSLSLSQFQIWNEKLSSF